MNIPTVKTLLTIKGMDLHTAKAVRSRLCCALITCPSHRTEAGIVSANLVLIDNIGHGVEFIYDKFGKHILSYLNMGDPYEATIIVNHETQSCYVGNWGTFVENNPSKFN